MEGCQQALGCLGDIVYGGLEGSLVGFGGLAVAADLAHELQRGLLQLLLAGGWVKVKQRADVPAQNFLLGGYKLELLYLNWKKERMFCQ